MKTPRTAIASAIAAHTLHDGSGSGYARQVAALLLYEGRVGELDSLLRDVQADWATQGHVEVLARSAHPLSATARKTITAQMKSLYPQAKTIIVSEVPDESVIGGVQLYTADKRLDLSVAGKLNQFRQLTGAGKE